MKFLMSFLICTCLYVSLHACSTPVFQYALERLEPEPYDLYILHDKKLTPEQKAKAESVEQYFESFSSNPALYAQYIQDIKDIPENLSKHILSTKKSTWPLAVLAFPGTDMLPHPLYSTPLKDLDTQSLLSSPLRTELAKRLAGGHSCVWIIVKSKDQEKNKKVISTLESSFKKIIPTLQNNINERLQSMEFDESGGELDDGTLNTGIPTVKASIMLLDRDNKQEALLLGMLTRLIPEIHDMTDPVAFPIYGRGRALWPMPAKDVTPDNIDSTLSFLCGSCSCQIKDENPGYDLMLSVDWDSIITDTYIGQTEMPELTGPTAHAETDTDSTPTSSPNLPTPQEEKQKFGLFFIIAAIVALSALIMGTIRIFKQRDS